MGASTGRLFVGMKGAREAISLVFDDATVDWSAAKTLTLTITQANGTVVTNTTWIWSQPTATSARATWVPDGTELTVQGRAHLLSDLTVGGTFIGTHSWLEPIGER